MKCDVCDHESVTVEKLKRYTLNGKIIEINLCGVCARLTKSVDEGNMISEYAQSDTVKTLVFDVDGCIFEYDGWQGIDHYGKPIQEMIDCINKLYNSGKYEIAIWSCRTNPFIQGYPQALLMARLIRELGFAGVKYHKILYEYKPLFHCIIDDNSVNPDRIKAMRLMALLDD
jgi:hypothetical protein